MCKNLCDSAFINVLLVLLFGSCSCLVVLSHSDLVFTSYLTIFHFTIIPMMPVCFLRRNGKDVKPEGRGCGEKVRGWRKWKI